PVSLLVRNVLEGALDLVEDIVGQTLHGARGRDDGLDDVYGWQELILNRGADCTSCASALRAGDTAYRGLCDPTGPPVFLCVACVGRLGRSAGREENTT